MTASAIDLRSENPIHQISGPRTAWTTTNAAEAFPGVMTPLGYSYLTDLLERGLRAGFAAIGVLRAGDVHVPASIDERTSGVFFGRFAGNVDTFRRFSDLTPGTSGDAFERQMFGSVRPGVASHASKRRYPAVAVKAPVTVARLPRWVRASATDVDTWWRAATGPGADRRPAMVRFHDARAVIERLLQSHMVAAFVAQGLFQQLEVLAAAAQRPGLELRLATGYGSLEETHLVAHLRRVACDGAPLDGFLARYGFHGPAEGELSSHSWRERPEILEALLPRYRESSRGDPLQGEAVQAAARRDAERELLAALPPTRRAGARVVLRLAPRYVPLREVTKASFLRGIDGARAAARARGAELVAAGALHDVEDVFYLTLAEIDGAGPGDARTLVDERRARRREYENLVLPAGWVGNPAPVSKPAPDADGDRRSEVGGIGASAGVIEGPVRVITDALDCDQLEQDEILVCHTTDPSWASAFHLVAAVVIDIGGPASHGAIISRELGLPCVINTGDGTRALRTGDVVRVDGTAGRVVVLQPAP